MSKGLRAHRALDKTVTAPSTGTLSPATGATGEDGSVSGYRPPSSSASRLAMMISSPGCRLIGSIAISSK